MSEETKHKVSVEYTATDHASPTAQKIAHEYTHAGHAVEGVKEKFKEFRHESVAFAAGIFGIGAFGLGALTERAGEAIREFGGVQRQVASTLATVLQWDKGTDSVEKFARASVLAKGVTSELDEVAGRFNLQLNEVGSAYKTIAISAAPLKLTQEQLLELTTKASAAAKQFGIDGATAASEIGRAMVTKTIRAGDDLGKFLFQNLGNKLKGLSNQQVFEKMNKALSQSVGIADEMGKGWSGSINRIHLRVQELMREVGGPLFASIAKSLDSLSKKLGRLGEDGKPLLATYGKRLVEAFEKMKDLGGFIVDHWRTIAVIIAGIKLPGLLATGAGLLGGVAGGAGGLLGVFKNVGSSFGAMMGGGGASGIAGFIGALGPATAAIVGIGGAAVMAAMALKGIYDEWQGRKQQAAGLGEFFKEMGEVNKTQNLIRKHDAQLSADQIEYMKSKSDEHAGVAAKILEQKGLLEDGRINIEKFNGIMASMSDDVRDNFTKLLGSIGQNGSMSSGMLGAAAAEIFNRNYRVAAGAADAANGDLNRRTGGVVQNFTGPINIQQNFEDQDPDRVFLRFKDDLESYARRPTASPHANPFGD